MALDVRTTHNRQDSIQLLQLGWASQFTVSVNSYQAAVSPWIYFEPHIHILPLKVIKLRTCVTTYFTKIIHIRARITHCQQTPWVTHVSRIWPYSMMRNDWACGIFYMTCPVPGKQDYYGCTHVAQSVDYYHWQHHALMVAIH